MPPEKSYTASEVMKMNRRDRRRIGAMNGVKISGIQDKPVQKKINSDDAQETISKMIDERNPINPKLIERLRRKKDEKNRLQK